jgi:hypothetical protein
MAQVLFVIKTQEIVYNYKPCARDHRRRVSRIIKSILKLRVGEGPDELLSLTAGWKSGFTRNQARPVL